MKWTRCLYSSALILSAAFAIPAVSTAKLSAPQLAGCRPPAGFLAVQTQEDLDGVRRNMSANYFLCNDIALSGEFEPLGNPLGSAPPEPFTGTFEGNKKTISNLHITEPLRARSALFARIGSSGIVANLTLRDVEVEGGISAAALAVSNLGMIFNCHLRGTGHILAHAEIPNFYSTAGGLIGSSAGQVYDSSAAGDMVVTARNTAGGLIGAMGSNDPQHPAERGAVLINSWAAISVKESDPNARGLYRSFGGLVGNTAGEYFSTPRVTIARSFSKSTVVSQGNNGGLVGVAILSDIKESFSVSSLLGDEYLGGLIGIAADVTITDSYFNGPAIDSGRRSYHFGTGLFFLGAGIEEHSTVYRALMFSDLPPSPIFAGMIQTFMPHEQLTLADSYFNTTGNAEQQMDDLNIGRTAAELKTMATYQPHFSISRIGSPEQTTWKIGPDGQDFPHLAWELR